jgi:hypothetical protein
MPRKKAPVSDYKPMDFSGPLTGPTGEILINPSLACDAGKQMSNLLREFSFCGVQEIREFAKHLSNDAIDRYPVKFPKIILEGLLAYCRMNDIPWISIGANDLIGPDRIPSDIRNKLEIWHEREFIWQVGRHIGFDGSCGNGMGDSCRQSQIHGKKYFTEEFMGVWDTKTETKICPRPFSLYSKREMIVRFYKAAIQGTDHLEEFINSSYFREHHLEYKYDSKHRGFYG